VFFRYREICGEKISFPEYGYKGDYIKDIAQNIYQRESKSLLEKEEKEAVKICAEYASNTIMEDIKNDLKKFRINFTNYFHEIFLYPDQIEKAINYLKEKDLVYCKDNALWFKSTSFGDDKDRVLKKSDGSYTYFASDTAYHQNKLSRNYDELIDIWGADHHGYVSRIMAAFNALSPEDCKLHIILVQLVNLLEKGERISMSTRGGQFETLRDVIKEVGVDACRFMFLTKSTNTHLDFDIQIAKEQSMDNPVYYVQYAHARICNIFEQAKRKKINIRENVGNYILKTEEEKNIVKELVILREAMDKSVQELEPFYVVKSLINIACAFHQFYNRRRVIGAEEEIMQSRFKLIDITKKAISTGLSLIGVSAPKQM
jgi:arginyl-tRNA synthetase